VFVWVGFVFFVYFKKCEDYSLEMYNFVGKYKVNFAVGQFNTKY